MLPCEYKGISVFTIYGYTLELGGILVIPLIDGIEPIPV